MKKENENRISETVETAMKNLKEMVDVNTVIGSPIKTESGYILPISKVTLGVLCGGGEYGKVSIFSKTDLPFSAGNGAVVSVKPCGFLIDDKNGYKILSIDKEPIEKIFDKTTDIISKIKGENNEK